VTESVATGATGARCLNGGWKTMHDDLENLFRNQEDRVRYDATGNANPGSVRR
jgi:hypothetical protein